MLFGECDHRVPLVFLCNPLLLRIETASGPFNAAGAAEARSIHGQTFLGYVWKPRRFYAIVLNVGTGFWQRLHPEFRSKTTTEGILKRVAEGFVGIGFPASSIEGAGSGNIRRAIC